MADESAALKILQQPPAWGLPSSTIENISLLAYLRLASVSFSVENLDDDPESELLPVIEFGNEACFANVDGGQLEYLKARHGVDLNAALIASEQADVAAFSALLESSLADSLEYELWLEEENFEIASTPYSVGLPWPLRKILCWFKSRNVKSYFTAKYGHQPQGTTIYKRANAAIKSLSDRLGSGRYFFGEKPSSLDALAFAHLIFHLRAPLVVAPVKEAIKEHENLVAFAERLQSELFGNDTPREIPPFSRVPKEKSSPKDKVQEDPSKALQRRAKYFLSIQAASIVIFILFSTFSVVVTDEDIEDDDEEDM